MSAKEAGEQLVLGLQVAEPLVAVGAEIIYKGETILSEIILSQHSVNYSHEMRWSIAKAEGHPVVLV